MNLDRRAFLARAGLVVASAALPFSRLLPPSGPSWWTKAAQEVTRFSEGRYVLVNAPDRTWAATIMDKTGKVIAYVDETARVWWPSPTYSLTFERGSRLVR